MSKIYEVGLIIFEILLAFLFALYSVSLFETNATWVLLETITFFLLSVSGVFFSAKLSKNTSLYFCILFLLLLVVITVLVIMTNNQVLKTTYGPVIVLYAFSALCAAISIVMHVQVLKNRIHVGITSSALIVFFIVCLTILLSTVVIVLLNSAEMTKTILSVVHLSETIIVTIVTLLTYKNKKIIL